jgi:hypothetical protein
VQEDAPAERDVEPVGQRVHFFEVGVAEKEPMSQGVQASEPGVPAIQPAEHEVQVDADVAPSIDDALPAEQARHPLEDWPVSALNVPAGQSEHAERPALV